MRRLWCWVVGHDWIDRTCGQPIDYGSEGWICLQDHEQDLQCRRCGKDDE